MASGVRSARCTSCVPVSWASSPGSTGWRRTSALAAARGYEVARANQCEKKKKRIEEESWQQKSGRTCGVGME